MLKYHPDEIPRQGLKNTSCKLKMKMGRFTINNQIRKRIRVEWASATDQQYHSSCRQHRKYRLS